MARTLQRAAAVAVLALATACGSSPSSAPSTASGLASTTTKGPAGAAATTATTAPTITGTAAAGRVDTGWLDGTLATTATPCTGTVAGRAEVYAPTLVVLDAATGALRWQFCPSVASAGISGAVAGDTIQFASGVPHAGIGGEYAFAIAGLDAATGGVHWQTDHPTGSPRVVDDRTVVLPTDAAQSPDEVVGIKAIDPVTGKERWRRTDMGVVATADTSYTGTDYVLGLDGTEVVALTNDTGDERWRTSAITRATHAFAGSVVGSKDGPPRQRTVVIDAADGSERWGAVGDVLAATERVVVLARVDDTRPPNSVWMTTAMATTPVWTMEVRDITTGETLWTDDLSSQPSQLRPTDGQGLPTELLPMAGSNMAFEMRAALDGTVLWSTPGPLMPVLGDDHLLLTVDRDVVAYDARTGAEAWRFAIPCIADRTGCMDSSYVQNTAMHNGLVVLAINDFNGG